LAASSVEPIKVMGDNPEGFEQAVTGFLNSFA